MNSIHWKDNGIFFSIVGCLALVLLVVAEWQVQGLTSINDSVTIAVDADVDTDNDENLDIDIELSRDELQLAKTISRHIMKIDDDEEAELTWKFARSEYPQVSPKQWLEVAKNLYERKHYQSSELIYKNLLLSDANHRSFEITKDIKDTALFQLARTSSQQNRYSDAIKYYQQLLESKPYHGVTLINLGLALARENRHSEAVDILSKADEHNSRGPKKAKALAAKGASLLELGDNIAAQAAFEQSILYRPQDAPTRRKLAEAQIANNDSSEDVLETLNKAILLQKNYLDALHDRARYYWKMGEFNRARDDLQTIRKASSSYLPARWTALHLYLHTDREQQANEELIALRNADLNDQELLLADAIGSLEEGDNELALSKLESIDKTNKDPWVNYYKALTLFKLDKRDAAITELQSLHNDFWLSEISRLKTAEWLRQDKNFALAETLLVALQQKYPGSVLYAETLGDLYLEDSKPQAAIPILQQAAAMTDDNRQIRLNLANAFVLNNQPDQALETFRALVQDYPHHTTTLFNYAQLLNSVGEKSDAANQLQLVMELDAAHEQAQMLLSDIYEQEERFEEAATLLSTLLQANPNHFDARRKLINIYLKDKKWLQAGDETERLLALTPDDTSLKLIKSRALKHQRKLAAAADTLFELKPDEQPQNFVQLLLDIGVRATDSEEHATAEKCFVAALKHSQGNATALENLVEFYNITAQYQRTIETAKQYSKQSQNNDTITIQVAVAHYHLGDYELVTTLLKPLVDSREFSAEAERILEDSQRQLAAAVAAEELAETSEGETQN